jgi:hypothetical protein
LVAFIDILGFGSLIRESTRDAGSEETVIARIWEALTEAVAQVQRYSPQSDSEDVRFSQFSDSFVISAPVGDEVHHSLFYFSSSIQAILDEMLRSRLFLRGGIAIGGLVHKDGLPFGPAMNRAYELETKVARVPRIVLDPAIPDLVTSRMQGLWATDTDGLRYLDYFYPGKAYYLIPGWLRAIQEAIEALPPALELDEKRNWLISKYNTVVGGYLYDEFKRYLDDYMEDGDNPAVARYYDELLADAIPLREL